MKDQIHSIEGIRAVVTPIANKYNVKRIALFGSFARNEAKQESDIDLHLIETASPWGYFTLCGFRQDLEAALGVSVDVLTTGAMDNEVLERIQKDEVLIYEQ